MDFNYGLVFCPEAKPQFYFLTLRPKKNTNEKSYCFIIRGT